MNHLYKIYESDEFFIYSAKNGSEALKAHLEFNSNLNFNTESYEEEVELSISKLEDESELTITEENGEKVTKKCSEFALDDNFMVSSLE